MREAVDLLARLPGSDRESAFAAIGEAVWCVTIVDATLNRHQPGPYDAVLTHLPRTERPLVEGTLAGLRFVRNQIGQEVDVAAFIVPGSPRHSARSGGIVGWTWMSASRPDLASLSQRAQVWEMARYRAYQDQLADHRIGEGFQRAVGFLNLASCNAAPDTSTHAAP
jgi:hypothetical protein